MLALWFEPLFIGGMTAIGLSLGPNRKGLYSDTLFKIIFCQFWVREMAATVSSDRPKNRSPNNYINIISGHFNFQLWLKYFCWNFWKLRNRHERYSEAPTCYIPRTLFWCCWFIDVRHYRLWAWHSGRACASQSGGHGLDSHRVLGFFSQLFLSCASSR